MVIIQGPDVQPPPPTLWRIIRAFLNVRESATGKDIRSYAQSFLPHTNAKQIENKLQRLIRAGDIKRVGWSVYKITQQGKQDLQGPDGEGLHDLSLLPPPSPQHQPSTGRAQPTAAATADTTPPTPSTDNFLAAEMTKHPIEQQPEQVNIHITDPVTGIEHDIVINLRIKVTVELG